MTKNKVQRIIAIVLVAAALVMAVLGAVIPAVLFYLSGSWKKSILQADQKKPSA